MSSDPTNIKGNIGLFTIGSVDYARQRLSAATMRQLLDAEPIRKMLWDINLLQVSLSRAVEQIAMLELTVQMLTGPTVPTYEWHAHDYQPQPMSVSANAFEWKSPPNAVNGNS